MDTLRADYVSANGSTKVKTPGIDRLAAGGANFLNARTAVPMTLPAHASIMTSLYPASHGVRDNGTFVLGPDKLTLAEVLKQQGYSTAAFLASFVLDHRFGLNQGFDVYDDRVTGDPARMENLDAERSADDVDTAFAAWLDRQKSSPVFVWIHLYDPHAPYVPPEPYRTQYRQNPYAGEVAYADMVVGKILQQLQARKWIDNSIIALVGDHGEALGEHEETTHSVLIYNSTLHVPMMIYAPGLIKPGTRIDSLSRTIDLAPTLLAYLGISAKLGEGVSWKSAIEPGGKPPDVAAGSESLYAKLNLGWAELTGVESGKYHYIFSPKPELYDTQTDPAELKNLAGAAPAVARDMRKKLESLWPRSESKPQQLDEETREKLSSLGYLSGSTAPAKSGNVNPRDKMAVSYKIQAAIADFTLGKYSQAAAAFQGVLATEPEIPLLYEYLGLSYLRLAQYDDARRIYEAGIKRGINSSSIQMNLGIIDIQTRQLARAQTELEAAVSMDQRNVTALFHLADVHRMNGDPAGAVEYYGKALQINPEFFYAVSGLGMAYAALKNDDKAIQYFQQAVQMQPQNPPGYFNLAVQLERAGRSGDAVANYRKFLDLSRGKGFDELRKRATDALARLN